VRTDASKIGIGAVLFQVIEGVEEPVAFLSKSFSQTESAWSTIEQELFSVVYACEKWAPMILGHHFVVESDHRNLQWLEKATAPKLVRWRLRLQEFDFDLRHLPGKYMVVADALSRLHAKKATPFAGRVCSRTVDHDVAAAGATIRWCSSAEGTAPSSAEGAGP
jgi:hypothetical protein